MKVELEIEIETPHAREVEEALRVDNTDIPEGLKLSTYHNDKAIYIVAECDCEDPKRVLTLRNTVDEILTHIRAVLQVFEATK